MGKIINLKNFEIGADKLTILAGPCAIESWEILDETAGRLKEKITSTYSWSDFWTY